MNLSVLTIFPDLFDGFWNHGIIKRAIDGHKIVPATINVRDFAKGRHKVTDDRPYGGGCGMVMKPEPLTDAIAAARAATPAARTVLLTPQGRRFDQRTAQMLAAEKGLIFVCGRYEGVDERVYDHHIDLEVSIGDYVLTGGEVAAMVVMDAITRLIPGTLGNEDSAGNDSFSKDLLEHAHYTRPRTFEKEDVPDVLLSGNHGEIEKWRYETSLIRTLLKRPDLLKDRPMGKAEVKLLEKWRADIDGIIKGQAVCGADTPPRGG